MRWSCAGRCSATLPRSNSAAPVPVASGFPHFDKLLDYYRRGANEWYLWWGNDVISRERRGLLRRVSGRLAHRLDSTLGRLPPLVILATPENERAIVRMEGLRRRVITASALSVALVASLGIAALLAIPASSPCMSAGEVDLPIGRVRPGAPRPGCVRSSRVVSRRVARPADDPDFSSGAGATRPTVSE